MVDAMWGLSLIIGWLAMANVGSKSVYDFTVNDIDGNSVNMGTRYSGKVLLIVNVATF